MISLVCIVGASAQTPRLYDAKRLKPAAEAQARLAARELFAEARAAAAATPEVSRPEYFAYIAHQELAAGETDLAGPDLRAAFQAALALPATGLKFEVKREVEPDVVEALVETGDVAGAERLGIVADAARAVIADELVGAELAHGEAGEAWRVWDAMAAKSAAFPFAAAAALLAAKPARPARRLDVEASAASAAANVASMGAAEEAIDYLESAAAARQPPLALADTVRKFAQRLNALDGAAWDLEAVHKRAAALEGHLDQEHPVAALRLQPKLRQRPGQEAMQRSPASDLMPHATAAYTSLAEGPVLHTLSPDYVPRGKTPADQLSAQAAAGAPSYVARWALDYYCRGQAADAHAILLRALAVVEEGVAKPRAADIIDYDGAPFWVYGLAAQFDFATARAHAEALPGGWFKPLALAHVARMAQIAAENRPGRCTRIYYY